MTCIYDLNETHFRPKDLHRLKVNGWKKYSKQIDMKKKKAGVAVLTSDKLDFKTKAINKKQTRSFSFL